ncbi:MAG: PilW family protein [Ramlibacter sp.]
MARQAGLTLIEFMVSIVIGMILIAAIATLIANQSATRVEIDKSGRMIENGRYAAQVMTTDMQMAGYWGEYAKTPGTAAALPDPCTKVEADVLASMALHVQGYDAPATLPTDLAVCVKNHKPGTDVVVIRRVDADTTATETAGVTDLAKVVAGQFYLQTGLESTGQELQAVMKVGVDAGTDAANFVLKKKGLVNLAPLRKVIVNIYYISQCSVQVGTSCVGADNGSPIPTLKRVELSAGGGTATFTTMTIAEGIENMQIDYGVDTDADGAPNGADVNGSALTFATWPDVMTMKIHLLARSGETTRGFLDTKTYALGTHGTASAATGEEGYKRHAFVQSVRLVNPAMRRVL